MQFLEPICGAEVRLGEFHAKVVGGFYIKWCGYLRMLQYVMIDSSYHNHHASAISTVVIVYLFEYQRLPY